MELQDYNYWWIEKGLRDIPLTRRTMFYEMWRELKRAQIQVLIGLRRVGKSVMLFQIIDELIKSGVNPLNILYCNFDEPDFREMKMSKILGLYSEITNVEYKRVNIYLFLDEVQKYRNWDSEVKIIYDNFKNIKIVISGSASLNIIKRAKESLAGRAIYHILKPLSFVEFLRFKGITIEEKEIRLYEDLLKREFNAYIYRTLPEIVHEKEINFVKKCVRDSVIDPIILRDIPKGFEAEGVDVLLVEQLLKLTMENPGQHLNVDDLAKDLRRAKQTIYKTLFYLETSFICKRILNFRPSVRAASRKLARIYPYHPILTLPYKEIPVERYIENLIISDTDARFYWRDREKEVDILAGDSLPIEVKYKSEVKREDLKALKYFMQRYKCTKGIVVTKDLSGKKDDISLIPAWLFCLKGMG